MWIVLWVLSVASGCLHMWVQSKSDKWKIPVFVNNSDGSIHTMLLCNRLYQERIAYYLCQRNTNTEDEPSCALFLDSISITTVCFVNGSGVLTKLLCCVFHHVECCASLTPLWMDFDWLSLCLSSISLLSDKNNPDNIVCRCCLSRALHHPPELVWFWKQYIHTYLTLYLSLSVYSSKGGRGSEKMKNTGVPKPFLTCTELWIEDRI